MGKLAQAIHRAQLLPLVLVTFATLVVLAISGCGDDGNGSDETGESTGPTNEFVEVFTSDEIIPSDALITEKDTLLVASGTKDDGKGGIWRSTDGGESFEQVFWQGAPVSHLTSGRTNGQERLYAAAADSDAPFLLASSDDDGASWSEIDLEIDSDYNVLGPSGLHAGDDDVLYMRTLVSRDGGQNWTDLPLVEDVGQVTGIEPAGSTVVYARTRASSLDPDNHGGDLYRSADKGATWTHIYEDENDERLFGLYAFDEQHVWLGLDDGTLMETDDAGSSWTEVLSTDRFDDVDFGRIGTIASNAQGDILLSSAGSFVASRDGGQSWPIEISQYMPLSWTVLDSQGTVYAVESVSDMRMDLFRARLD
jgi:photosystem II stability/assembly factor-like uncharacterized protein